MEPKIQQSQDHQQDSEDIKAKQENKDLVETGEKKENVSKENQSGRGCPEQAMLYQIWEEIAEFEARILKGLDQNTQKKTEIEQKRDSQEKDQQNEVSSCIKRTMNWLEEERALLISLRLKANALKAIISKENQVKKQKGSNQRSYQPNLLDQIKNEEIQAADIAILEDFQGRNSESQKTMSHSSSSQANQHEQQVYVDPSNPEREQLQDSQVKQDLKKSNILREKLQSSSLNQVSHYYLEEGEVKLHQAQYQIPLPKEYSSKQEQIRELKERLFQIQWKKLKDEKIIREITKEKCQLTKKLIQLIKKMQQQGEQKKEEDHPDSQQDPKQESN